MSKGPRWVPARNDRLASQLEQCKRCKGSGRIIVPATGQVITCPSCQGEGDMLTGAGDPFDEGLIDDVLK